MKIKDVPLGERILGKLLILPMHAWDEVQAKLLPYYFLLKKGNEVMTTNPKNRLPLLDMEEYEHVGLGRE